MGKYGLLMAFWIDTEGYTDRDREMFVCGVEYAMIYAVLCDGREWNQCIHTENESRVRMMCAKMGVRCEMSRSCETWTHCTAGRSLSE